MFKPLDTIANPLGLCRFYWTDPQKSNVITGLKSMASTRKNKHMLKLAKELGQPLTIMVFEGGTVTPLGLLQELHSRLTLLCIAIHTLEEVKVGQKNRMSCYPICTYVVKDDYWFLNHIIIRHYWSSFSCGKCLEFAASSRQQMKRHFHDCNGSKKACKKKCSKDHKASEVQSSQEYVHKSKKGKKDKADKEKGAAQKRRSHMDHHPSLSVQTLPQEQPPDTPHHSKHIAGSTSGHHKKSKKHDKKSHKKSE